MISHHWESLSPVIYLVQTQVPLISSSTQKRQAFLVDHVFSTPLNFKIYLSPQSHYSILSVLPHCTPSLESLNSKRGVVLQFFLFYFVYLCLFIILEVSHGAAALTHFSLTHIAATLLTHSTAIVLTHSIAILIMLPHWCSIYSGQSCRLFLS